MRSGPTFTDLAISTPAGPCSGLGGFDRLLLRHAGAEQRRLERALARRLGFAWSWPSAPARIALPAARLKRVLSSAALATAAAASAAGLLAVNGYVQNDEAFWRSRIDGLAQAPIYSIGDNKRRMLVGSRSHYPDVEHARKYGYLPLRAEEALPSVFAAGILFAENRNYYNPMRSICGLDPVASLGSFISSGGSAGGSTVTQQLARSLKPEWGQERTFIGKAMRKAQEWGAACRLHRVLTAGGDVDAPLRLYASYFAVWQGNGSLRGIEAGSRITWGKPVDALEDHEQLILAAAARRPIALVTPADVRVPCEAVHPRRNNENYMPELANAHPARAGQCALLARAEWIGRNVLSGDRAERAVRELRRLREQGIHPLNEFQRVPARRLINLVSRTAATMAPALLRRIGAEADAAELPPTEPLMLALNAQAQIDFRRDFERALDQAQHAPGNAAFCVPLREPVTMPTASPARSIRRCGLDVPESARADVLAVKFDLVTGAIVNFYGSTAGLLDAPLSMGSLHKWPIALAALDAGWTADSRICPLQANDGVRRLRRVSQPIFGVQHCNGGANTLALHEAMAKSDSLAFYQLARTLGDARLRGALDALGIRLTDDGTPLAYALAFGTAGVTPHEMMSAAQAMLAAAYDLRTTGTAPRVLAMGRAAPSPAAMRVAARLPRTEQRAALRTLLEAPVSHPAGTLRFLAARGVDAGKSGTVSAIVRGVDGRAPDAAKLAVTFSRHDGTVNFLYVASPTPSIPLARRALGATDFAPLHHVLTPPPRNRA